MSYTRFGRTSSLNMSKSPPHPCYSVWIILRIPAFADVFLTKQSLTAFFPFEFIRLFKAFIPYPQQQKLLSQFQNQILVTRVILYTLWFPPSPTNPSARTYVQPWSKNTCPKGHGIYNSSRQLYHRLMIVLDTRIL